MPAMPSARVRTRSRDVQQNLLDAAEVVLARDGLAGVTIRAVAAEAGVAPMGVYNRFGSKDGLIAALVVRAFDLLREAVDVPDEPDAVRRLRRSGQRYRAFALSHPQHYSLIFLSSAGHGIAEHFPDVEEHARAAFEALVAQVAYGMQTGAIEPGDAFDLAQQIWSTVHGAVALELFGLVLTEDPGATYEHLLDLLTAGLTR
jgi:AcrR family transcriptional regulator